MPARTVQCAKLGQELPGLDPDTSEGSQALRMGLLLGGPELRQRIHDHVSAQAWAQWKDRMLMVINEYRLDPTSDASNSILREHLEGFFFGEAQDVPGYIAPDTK